MAFSTKLAIAIAVGAQLLLGVSAVYAQEQPGSGVVVSANGAVPLVVDNIDVEKLPLNVAAGARVCAPGPRVYKSEGDRYTFQQWSTGASEDCIIAASRGAYRALYAHEVLLVIKSTAPGVQRSMWVPYGSPITLEVPSVVADGDDTRFRFQGWSDGEAPFDRVNTIAPVKPTTLEVKWAREHRLQVEAPDGAALKGSGWYAEGTNLVLRAPETYAGDTDQDRWRFAAWESTSFPAVPLQNPQTPQTIVKIDMPYAVRANYARQFLVQASSPVGTLKREWINAGQDVVLEAPAIVDVVPDQERLVFKRWDGMEGLLSPRISGLVDKPIIVSANYERQAMLKVNAPHGAAGDGWHKIGDVVAVSAPPSVPQALIFKSSFSSFGGYPAGQSTIQVLLNEPTVLTAVYRTEPDWLMLLLVLGLPLAAVLIYLEVTRGWVTRQRMRVSREWLPALGARFRRGAQADASAATESSIKPTELPVHRNGSHTSQPLSQQQR